MLPRSAFVASLAVPDAARVHRVKTALFVACLYPLASLIWLGLTGGLGADHFWWLVKLDITRPLIYSVIVGALLVARIVFRFGTNGLAISAAQNAARMRHSKAG